MAEEQPKSRSYWIEGIVLIAFIAVSIWADSGHLTLFKAFVGMSTAILGLVIPIRSARAEDK